MLILIDNQNCNRTLRIMDVNEALLHNKADLGVANGESTNLLIPVSFILGLGLLLSLMVVVGIVCCCCDHDLNKILKNRKTHSEAMEMKISDSNSGNDRRIKYSFDQEEDEENKGQGYK